jgi:LDH2 family malate/lactate/ureidoglycolate dehydrogenase
MLIADHPTIKGDLFIAINPGSLPGSDDLSARSSTYLDRIRSSRPAPGTDAVSIPGDQARRRRLTGLNDDITLSHTAWQAALKLAS